MQLSKPKKEVSNFNIIIMKSTVGNPAVTA